MAKKLYYKIGEACKELDIQPYVLRYWETEFPLLKPDKSRSGQRVYSGEDLGVIRRIKELLYEEGYTIAGAKKKLEAELDSGRSDSSSNGGGRRQATRAGDDPADRAVTASAALDTLDGEKVETIARRVRALRDEAQQLLDLLRVPKTE